MRTVNAGRGRTETGAQIKARVPDRANKTRERAQAPGIGF